MWAMTLGWALTFVYYQFKSQLKNRPDRWERKIDKIYKKGSYWNIVLKYYVGSIQLHETINKYAKKEAKKDNI